MDVPENNDFLPVNDNVELPSFYRLNSEVVEKPSTFDDGRQENFVASSSSPSPSPVSHSSLYSTVNEGGECWWLPNWPNGLQDGRDMVANGDDLLALSLCVAGGLSDSELEAQGDVDEGFDEEFEEKDLNESDSNNHHHHQAYPDLDPKEVQELLGEDQLMGLDDFDLGVDVLDSEHGQAIMPLVSLASSPMSHVTTPDRVLSPSPAPSLDPHVQALQRNRWNLSSDGFSPANSPISGNVDENNMEPQEVMVGTSDFSEEQLAMLVSACGTERTYDQAPLMDLSETIALANSNPLLTLEPANSDLQSMLQFANGSGHLPFLPPPSSTDLPTTSDSMGHVTSQVLMDSNIFSNLNFSHVNNDYHGNLSPLYRHPPPAASPLSTASTSLTCTPPPSPSPSVDQDTFTIEERNIIDMPWYRFRKVLDDSSVPDTRKEDMKNARRKGKNKAAAKVCRQKKMRNIKGLEKEIQELKKTKQQMAFRSRSLEREVAQLKKQCQQTR